MKNPLTSLNLIWRERPFCTSAILAAWVVFFCVCGYFAWSSDSSNGRVGEDDSKLVDELSDNHLAHINYARIRICTYNLKNYSVADRGFGRFSKRPKPESEKAEVVKTLKEIDADIVMLNEIGDEGFLKELRRELAKAGANYRYFGCTARNAHARLGYLSRIKPSKIFDFSDQTFVFDGKRVRSPRGTLGLRFEVGTVSRYVFGIHLKSSVGAIPEDFKFAPFRSAELAAILAKIRSAIGVANPILICGDFNGETSSDAAPFEVVPQADSGGAQYTFKWGSNAYMYDYFIANPAMLLDLKCDARVFGINRNASDHSPVFADFDFSAFARGADKRTKN